MADAVKKTTPDLLPKVNEINVHVKKGENLTKKLVFTGGENIVLNILVEEEGHLDLREEYRAEGAYGTQVKTSVSLHKNAQMKHIKLQLENEELNHSNIFYIQQDKNSSYSQLLVNKGAKKSFFTIQSVLEGAYAQCAFKGVNLLSKKQKTEINICVEHQAENCQSDQFYRSVLDEWAQCFFQTKAHIFKEAQKTKARQMSNALLLSSMAAMNTKPELEIYADDVECAHGATTGQLNEDHLFYLRTRAIPEQQAKGLLIEGFIAEILDEYEEINV